MRRRVFLLDDHPLVREWLASLVAAEPEFEVCGQAEDTGQALPMVLRCKPDIIVLDLSLPRGSGLDFIKDVRGQLPGVRILVLTMHEEPSVAERAFRAGANGYAIKRETAPSIIDAIRTVADGKFYASPPLASELASRAIAGPRTSTEPNEVLSDRELEVFRLRGQGRSLKEIAAHLGVSVKTIGSYETRIKDKLGLTDAGDLMREAVLWHDRQRGI